METKTVPWGCYLLNPIQRWIFTGLSLLLRYLGWLVFVGFIFMITNAIIVRHNESDINRVVKVDAQNIYVSDNAHLLSAATKRQIKVLNHRDQKLANHPQFMVITIEELPAGESIENFTNRVANKLGVGNAKANNGVVYLLSKADRKARLEVGYGMESTIPDGMTDEITDSAVKTYYRIGNYNAGIKLVALRLDRLIRKGSLDAAAPDAEMNLAEQANEAEPSFAESVSNWIDRNGGLAFMVSMLFLWWLLVRLNRLGRWLRRYLRVNQLLRRFEADLRRLTPNLPPLRKILTTQEAQYREAYQKLAQERQAKAYPRPSFSTQTRKAHGNPYYVGLTGQPLRADYDSMAFAFGKLSVNEFFEYDARPSAYFRTTTVYLYHQGDWYYNETTTPPQTPSQGNGSNNSSGGWFGFGGSSGGSSDSYGGGSFGGGGGTSSW